MGRTGRVARTRAVVALAVASLLGGGCSGGSDPIDASPAATSEPVPTSLLASLATTTSLPAPSTSVVGPTSPTTTTTTTTTTSTTVSATTTLATPLDQLATLAEGDSGPDVVLLQRMLNNVTGTTIAPTGRYGPDTTEAVANFQAYLGLEATGAADHETRVRLVELDAGRSTALPRWPVPSIGNGGADGCQVAVVGDSLMAGATALHEQALARIGCASAVDGVGGRSLSFGWQCRVYEPDGRSILRLLPAAEPGNESCSPSGLELLQLWAAAGALGDLLVVALGTNDAGIYPSVATWESHWAEALRLAGGRPVLFLTTKARPGSNRSAGQDAYSAALRRWCDLQPQCRLADWALTDTANDVFSYVDSVHLRSAATEVRAEFIADAVRALFVDPPGPNPVPLPTTSTTTTSTTTTSTTTTSTTTTSTTSTTTSSTTTSTSTTVAPTSTTSTSTTVAPTSTTSTSTTVAPTSTTSTSTTSTTTSTTVAPTSTTSTTTTAPP